MLYAFGFERVGVLREVSPEIVDATRRLLDKVRAGELGTVPPDQTPDSKTGIRAGWL